MDHAFHAGEHAILFYKGSISLYDWIKYLNVNMQFFVISVHKFNIQKTYFEQRRFWTLKKGNKTTC